MEAYAREKLFICKFCNKRYPCGKSLGGHIRIHLNGNGNSIDAEDESFRENPKKTRKFMTDSNTSNSLQEKVCKECGKGFQSLKALCGHMACHSRSSFEDRSETSMKLKAEIFDSQSDNDTSSDSSRRRRSKKTRYKTIGLQSSSLFLTNGSSSSSASSDVKQEQEEVAKCLILLSKDSGFKGCFSSFPDPSDENSVALKTRSSSHKLRISFQNSVNCNGISEKKKAGNYFSVNSDSGYCNFGPKKLESEIFVHGFNKKDEIKNQEAELGSRFEDDFDSQLGKRLSRFRRIKTETRNDLTVENRYDETDRASLRNNCRKIDSNNDSNNPELLGKMALKPGKCSFSAKRIRHSKKNQSCNGQTRNEQNLSGNVAIKPISKNGKVHECPFCSKVFKSGQALGGHKRSHFVLGAEDRTVVINHEVPEMSMPALIDLNLPAPMEEDENENNIPSR